MEERIKEILDEHDNEEDLSNDFNFGQEEEKGNAKPLNSRTDNDRGALKIDKSTFRPNLGKSTTSSQQKGTLKSKLKLGKHREELKESPNILKSKKGYEGVQINMGDIELTEGIKNHPGSQYKKNHLNIKDEFLRESDRSSVPDRLDDQTRRARENNPEATFEERNTLKPEEPLKSDRVREIGINENDQEMQMFSERETELGYWGFLRSAKVQLWKKVGVVAYLILFLLSLVMSTIELIRYSESGCKRGLLITILYYIYFGFGIIFKFSFYIFTQMEYHGKIAYKWKVTAANQVPHLIPLSMVLVSISFQIGYYSYDYGLCQSINLVFTDPTSSELLSSRVAITILIYILLYLISLVLKSILAQFKKPSIKSFVKGWNSLLLLILYLIVAVLMALALLLVFTQNPFVVIGLLIETVLLFLLLVSAIVIICLNAKRKTDIFEIKNHRDDKYEEKLTLKPPEAPSN